MSSNRKLDCYMNLKYWFLMLALAAMASTDLVGKPRANALAVSIATQKAEPSAQPNGTLLGAQSVIGRRETLRSSYPVAVDGGKTPELIPDWLAYQQLIKASAMPANASLDRVTFNEARLKAIGFSQLDHDAYIAALVNVSEELDQVAADQQMWKVDTPTALAMRKLLRARKDQILEAARSRLQTALTFDGWTRLNSFVQNDVKRHITVYGTLPQLQSAR